MNGPRKYVAIGDDMVACDSMWKMARKTRHRRGRYGSGAVAHPTKKLTRGRIKAAYGARRLPTRRLSLMNIVRLLVGLPMQRKMR